jgi:hypothetical protein
MLNIPFGDVYVCMLCVYVCVCVCVCACVHAWVRVCARVFVRGSVKAEDKNAADLMVSKLSLSRINVQLVNVSECVQSYARAHARFADK